MTLLADTVCMSVYVEHYICYDIHMLDDSHSGSLIFFFPIQGERSEFEPERNEVKQTNTHPERLHRSHFFIFDYYFQLFPVVTTVIKQLKGPTTWPTVVTAITRQRYSKLFSEMVIWWPPVDSHCYYKSVFLKRIDHTTEAAGFTKHYLINDFAIQNICAKIFRQNTKPRPLLINMHVNLLWVHWHWNIHILLFLLTNKRQKKGTIMNFCQIQKYLNLIKIHSLVYKWFVHCYIST